LPINLDEEKLLSFNSSDIDRVSSENDIDNEEISSFTSVSISYKQKKIFSKLTFSGFFYI
jgi:hypothetical protein